MLSRKTLVAGMAVVLFACRREAPPPRFNRQRPKPAVAAAPVTPKAIEAAAPARPSTPPTDRDLPAIEQDRTFRVLFTFNSTGYFLYRGETMGYEYELLDRFAREMKWKLVPVVVRDSSTILEKLNRGEGDLASAQLVLPPADSDVLPSAQLYATPPVLVQRGEGSPAAGKPPEVGKAMAREQQQSTPATIQVRARLISRSSELAGERVHISRSSPYRRQLLELNNELENDIDVVEVDDSTDRLIQMLSEGEIGYTVAAANLAELKATEYANLIIKPALGPPQQVVWAMRRNAPALRDAVNAWLERQRRNGVMTALYRKYFLDRRQFQLRAKSGFLTADTGRLSPWDEWFRESARIPGWDWRLLAAQAYQESRFNPAARSWAGAVGVMQIMPRTARELRINAREPRQSIDGAARYLWKLDSSLVKALPREEERIKFILASYNVGLGHVEDAQRLAQKYGDDPGSWDDIAYWLIRKSKRSVYTDPVVKYGFARGTEPVEYVDRILQRFENYKTFVPAEPPAAAATTTSPAPVPR
jgi:membrane-bound lytic murein transglycosylase F